MSNRKRAASSPVSADGAPETRLQRIGARPPTAVRTAWRDPDDNDPNRRNARVVHGTRAYDAVLAAANRAGSLVTARHVKASQRYLSDYEVGVLGARPDAGERLPGTRSEGACYPSERQCDALRVVLNAQKAVGVMATQALRHVVLGIPDPEHRNVASYARRHGMDPKVAMGILVVALDGLADFYEIGEGVK